MFGLFKKKKNEIPDQLILSVIDLADSEKYDEALKVCDKIISIDSNYDRVYFERAMVYLNQDKLQLAASDFTKLIEINPNYPGGKDWYSKTLAELGKEDAAAQILYMDLKSNPEGMPGMGVSPNSWSECAELFIKAKDREMAKVVLNEYFDHHEKNVTNYRCYETAPIRSMAKLLLSLGESKNALDYAIRANDSEHKVPADYEILIEAYLENQEKDKAKELIEYYVEKIHGGFETKNIIKLKSKLE